MATTQNTYTGNGSTTNYSFTFPYLETTDIKVSVNGVNTTAYTLANATTISFNTAPANGSAIRIYRDTDDSALAATFYPGSAIRSQDLNDNFTQNLYVVQEINNNAVQIDGSQTMVGDLDMGGYQINNLAEPTVDDDAATKYYIDQRYGSTTIPAHTRWRKTATAGQTTFSGTGDYGGTLAYSALREQVYLNGALQQRSADYTADNGTSIVFSVPLTVGDVVDVVCVNNTNTSGISNAANLSYSGQFSGQTTRTVAAKLADVVSVKDFGAVGDGVADDTAAIQAAIMASKQIYFPEGTYLCSSVALTTSGLSGRKLTGASSTTTTLKAKASSTDFLSITGNYNQYNVFENLAIDMSLMPNTSASRGIYLKQTWGNSFRNVRVTGFGSSARSLYCDVGVYTTVFDNCEFGGVTGTIQLQGISLSNAVTTITFIGCSFAQCIADQVVSITFLQPIVQGALDKFVLSNTRGFSIISGDIEGTGTYLSLGSNVGRLCSTNNELSGFTGTYSTGSFNDGHLMDLYGSASFQFKPTSGSSHTGTVTEEITSAGLTRKLIRNTSGSSSTVDLQVNNSAGSSYFGMTGAGAAYLDGRGGGKVTLQSSGTDIVGGDSSNRLIIGTLTATTATAGTNGAIPAQVKGYIRFCNSSGTEIGKIPFYEL